jgi:hypothetical protein
MYGKKRIILTKEGLIVKAGGKSYHPIGLWEKDGLTYQATVLRPNEKWDRDLTVHNSERMLCQSKTEIRERVWDMYA